MPMTEIMLDGRHRGPMSFSLDAKEMTVLAFEAMTARRRPEGMGFEEAFESLKSMSPDGFQIANRVASRLLDYFETQVRSAQPEALQ